MYIKVKWLKPGDRKWYRNRLSMYFSIHTFSYGGVTTASLHFWPLYIEIG